MQLIFRIVPLVTLAACGVSNPTFLPPPGTELPPYPIFVGPAFATDAHDAVGFPDCGGTLLERDYFATCHDGNWLIARWVGYVLTATDLQGTTERTDNFRADPDLPNGGRAENSDYAEPTYDRGHMAPAGDFTRNSAAMSSTFYLSNIAPQHPELNQGEWADLENAVRHYVSAGAAAWIFTGNLVLDADGEPSSPQTRIGGNGVAVPTHCFKAILLQYPNATIRAAGFILPNRPTGVGRWVTSSVAVDELERLSGFDFFYELDDGVEDEIEALNWSL